MAEACERTENGLETRSLTISMVINILIYEIIVKLHIRANIVLNSFAIH